MPKDETVLDEHEAAALALVRQFLADKGYHPTDSRFGLRVGGFQVDYYLWCRDRKVPARMGEAYAVMKWLGYRLGQNGDGLRVWFGLAKGRPRRPPQEPAPS